MGELFAEAGGHTEDPVIAGGVLFAAGGIAGNIVFNGPSGTLATEPDSSGNLIGIPNQIIGFAPGDGVVLLGIAPGTEITSVVGDTVTIGSGAAAFTLDIQGASQDHLSIATSSAYAAPATK